MKLSVLKKNQLSSELDLSDLVVDGSNLETVLLIGRSNECHIVLDDKQISREHSRLIYLNGKWRIEKIAENPPLILNNDSVENGNIQSGDVVAIGAFTINFEENLQKNLVTQVTKTKEQIVVPPVDVSLSIKVPRMEPIIAKPIIEEEISQDAQEEITQVTDMNSLVGDLGFDSNTNASTVDPQENFNSFTSEEDVAPVAEFSSSESIPEEVPSYSLENISNDDVGDDGTKVFNTFAAVHLELFGEFAPYDKYNLEAGKTVIGRDPSKCKIVLNDPEVSSVHAVITKNNMLMTLEDLNSGNGTMLNGERINKATLNHRDEFIIGSTSFKVKVNSEFLKEESATLMPVEEDQTVEVEEVIEIPAEEGEQINALGEITSNEPQEKSIIKRIWKDEDKRKKLIYGIVGLVALWVFFGDEEPAKKPVVHAKKEEKSKDAKENKDLDVKADPKKTAKKQLTEEEKRALSERYQIGKKHFYEGRYRDALEELQKVAAVDPNFNTALQTLIASSKEGLSKLEEQEKKRKEEEAAAEKRVKVKTLVAKATEFVKDHRADLAGEIFNEIAKIDPENIEISRLKREMEDWTKEQQKIALEKAQKKRDREDRVEKLKPGKKLFLQKEWYRAANKLDDFLKIKDMDEDLTTEATNMLKIAREEVSNAVTPLQGKAKSLMEGQDLKGAYEVYQQILKIEPSNPEALNSLGEIREVLNTKARKIYREAIISESLSLFQDAKEKFQEVQQVSPIDSDYYKKASDKLKDYLD